MIFAPITATSVVELCILQGIFPQLRFNIKTEILIAKKRSIFVRFFDKVLNNYNNYKNNS